MRKFPLAEVHNCEHKAALTPLPHCIVLYVSCTDVKTPPGKLTASNFSWEKLRDWKEKSSLTYIHWKKKSKKKNLWIFESIFVDLLKTAFIDAVLHRREEMKQVDLRLAGATTHIYSLTNRFSRFKKKKKAFIRNTVGVICHNRLILTLCETFIVFQYQTFCTAPVPKPIRSCTAIHTE